MPWYEWALNFFETTNHYNFLCAANQISKSSTQIRKMIHWATAVDLWPRLWRMRPTQFWYLYPNKSTASIEVTKKWVEEFLPRGTYKDHPQYGWKLEIKNKEVFALHFNTGVSIYFKTYAQDAQDLQTGSVHYIGFDEELPAELWDELNFRIASTEGYMSGVFTATLGQEFWKEIIEGSGDGERLPDAFKQQVSMYDCLTYADGSPSHWTEEKITRIKNSCKNKNEILRRVYGRFIVDSGLKYSSFDQSENVIGAHKIPADWLIYAGVDIGSGGTQGHPAAIAYVGVSPDFRRGSVFMGWRGDGIQTTADDVLQKYLSLKANIPVTAAYYDWASKEFALISERNGIPFIPAEKGHDLGEQIINVLFKNKMLSIFDIDSLRPLAHELSTLQKSQPKNKAKDDFADALRYAVTQIPWDWSFITGQKDLTPDKPLMTNEELDRRGLLQPTGFEEVYGSEAEMESWNEMYDC